MTSRQVGLARLLAKIAFAGEGVVALAVLLGRGPDAVALVVAGILLASGLQVYGILRWPFARMLLEQVTRGAVLMSGLIVGISWTIDSTRDVLQQWLAVFVAGGAGLLGLAILRYLDYQEREEELRTALAAFVPAADVPRQATDAGTSGQSQFAAGSRTGGRLTGAAAPVLTTRPSATGIPGGARWRIGLMHSQALGSVRLPRVIAAD